MSHFHAVVWIDHEQAHVMHVSPDDVETSIVHPSQPHQHLHAHAGSIEGRRAPEDQAYYHRVVEALSGAQEILVVGPAQAKLQLIKHMHAHDPATAQRVVGVETIDHPSDKQVVAYARTYFRAKDRMI
jgi:stalled ribosome rescue protein Dom34